MGIFILGDIMTLVDKALVLYKNLDEAEQFTDYIPELIKNCKYDYLVTLVHCMKNSVKYNLKNNREMIVTEDYILNQIINELEGQPSLKQLASESVELSAIDDRPIDYNSRLDDATLFSGVSAHFPRFADD